jgi:hypothetical protein
MSEVRGSGFRGSGLEVRGQKSEVRGPGVQRFRGSEFRGSRVQRFKGSAAPPAKKTAGLIEKETDEHRTSNIQHRTSNECILSILKKI